MNMASEGTATLLKLRADLLKQLSSNPELAIAFGAEARRKVEREYNLALMLRRYAELYFSVLQKKEKKP